MAGLGRRTHYRKHLTDSVLYDLPEPKEYERIAKVTATRGGNQFDIILAGTTATTTSAAAAENSNRSGLALLPTKFHKLVWVKRNDYVIVQTGIDSSKEEEDNNNQDDEDGKEEKNQERSVAEARRENDAKETGIRFIISHILYKDQVKHLISKGFWPENDPEFSETGNTKSNSSVPTSTDESDEKVDKVVLDNNDDDDGIVYNTEYGDYDDGIVYTEYDDENDDDLFVNTNRIARLEMQDSDDDEGECSDVEELNK